MERADELEKLRDLGESERLTLARMLERRAVWLQRDADRLRRLARELVRVSEHEEGTTHDDGASGRNGGAADT